MQMKSDDSVNRSNKAEDENNLVLLEMKVIILEIYEVNAAKIN